MTARPLRTTCWIVVIIAVVTTGYLAVVAGRVMFGVADDAPDDAEAIVVLGAAQYDGIPSPALATRLQHAHDLWSAGVAPLIVVTGGQQPGDRFNEATAGRTWLYERGVPEEAIRREVHGRSTYEQLAATARFLRDEGVHRVVLVSDPLHSARLRLIADEVGLAASVSAARPSTVTWRRQLRLGTREVGAVAAGQLVGFRRLHNLMNEGPSSQAGPTDER